MKKFSIFIGILLLASSFVSQAQDDKMEIYNSAGELVPNGANLYTYSSSVFSKILSTDSLYVKNVSDETIKLKVRKVDYRVTAGTFNKFWALAQSVEPVETLTPNYWELESGTMTPDIAYFIGSYYPQNLIGTSSIIYSFLSVDENDKVLDSVFVCYAFSNTSITPFNDLDEVLYNKEVLVNCDPSEINEYEIKLYNHTLAGISCRVNKGIIETEEGHEMYFKYGGVEYGVDETSSDGNGYPIGVGETLSGENGFIALFNPNGIDGNEYLSKVEYKFFNKLNGNDADYVTLIYNPSGVGFDNLDGYNISKAYPNPANNQFNVDYSLNNFSSASMKIYQSNGVLIGNYPITNQSGTITVSTFGLSAGVYFYSIEIDGKPIGVEKVIVK
ncbi:MAG: T9SS type A sorting domain-containing protein [Bacteroidales bacterium]|nr:T9SS type A sorting domain-containing protein [Bacteroidales bacterium]